jgi:hypothetical protein
VGAGSGFSHSTEADEQKLRFQVKGFHWQTLGKYKNIAIIV